jgi:hypothetical protein
MSAIPKSPASLPGERNSSRIDVAAYGRHEDRVTDLGTLRFIVVGGLCDISIPREEEEYNTHASDHLLTPSCRQRSTLTPSARQFRLYADF